MEIVQETSEGNVVLGKGDLFLWQYRVYKNVVLTFATWELWNDYQREFKYNVWYCMFCEAKRLNRITQRLKCVQVYRIHCSGDLRCWLLNNPCRLLNSWTSLSIPTAIDAWISKTQLCRHTDHQINMFHTPWKITYPRTLMNLVWKVKNEDVIILLEISILLLLLLYLVIPVNFLNIATHWFSQPRKAKII